MMKTIGPQAKKKLKEKKVVAQKPAGKMLAGDKLARKKTVGKKSAEPASLKIGAAPKKAAPPKISKKTKEKAGTEKKRAAPKNTAVKVPAGRGRPKALDPAIVREIFTRFAAVRPHPRTELDYLNPFTLLVAVVLSAQATDVGVNKATRALFALADTPEKMLALGEDRVRTLIKTIGLYRTKAKNVIALSERLVRHFGGDVPRTRIELESLPGAGRKTANVVMNTAFGEPLIAVDTHIFRVSNRIPLAPGKTPLEVELGLEKIIPEEFKLHAHHWLILHGRYVCKARRPECEICVIADLCRSPEKTV
jgi:endonuclease-3